MRPPGDERRSYGLLFRESKANIRPMNALDEYLTVRGNTARLANALGITHAAVTQWKGKCPAERVISVEVVTGIPREALRPDLYRRAPLGAHNGASA